MSEHQLNRPVNGAFTSRYVYERSLIRDTCRVLADLRASTSNVALDDVIRALVDAYAEHDPNFDTERFCQQARYRYDIQPTNTRSTT